MASRKIIRREFLRLSAVAAAGAVAAACTQATPVEKVIKETVEVEKVVKETVEVEKVVKETVEVEKVVKETVVVTPTPVPSEAGEAPVLAELVGKGELPPVDERLPSDPAVWVFPDVDVFETERGEYGGTLRFGMRRDAGEAMGFIGLARLSADRRAYYPDIAESWETTPDAKSITFHLRKGMKWSDGMPFTVDDIMWWWVNVVQSKYRETPGGLVGMDTTRDKLVKVDDYTLRLDFAEPRPIFLYMARGCTWGEPAQWGLCAPHYMEQFHPDYNPESGKDATAQFEEMLDRFASTRRIEDPTRPLLWPFRLLQYEEGQLLSLERNPYFWTLDRWGRQLPYLDTVESFLLEDSDDEIIKLKLLAGETHFERRRSHIGWLQWVRENEDKAGFEPVFTLNTSGSTPALIFNYLHPDPQMRELMDQADFRRALSMAIDREAINQTAFLGLGKPGHGFTEKYVDNMDIDGRWAEFDPEKANAMLDALGLDQRDNEGFRTFPNGDQLNFSITYTPGWNPGMDEGAEISAEGWNDVRVRTALRGVAHSVRNQAISSGEVEVHMRPRCGGAFDMDLYFGCSAQNICPEMWTWWQAKDLPEAERPGVEPVGGYLELIQLQEEILSTTDPEGRERALEARWELLADQCYMLGCVMDNPHILVVSKKLRGVWGSRGEPGKVEMPYYLYSGDEDFWPRSWFFSE